MCNGILKGANFPKLMSTTKLQIIKQNKGPPLKKKLCLGRSYLNCKKTKIKKKILKEATEGKNNLFPYREAKIRITFNFSETIQEETRNI